ncbi:MAG: superoxide dismutase family protein [Rhodomicrobium sp.]
MIWGTKMKRLRALVSVVGVSFAAFVGLGAASAVAQDGSREVVAQQGHSGSLLDTMLRSGNLPVEFAVSMYRTSATGLGFYIGTITVRNTMIKIGGNDEPALILKANLVSLTPGPHAFHIHEYPDCGPKEKDGVMVPGLAAGAHLFAEHQEGSEMVTYKSHLGNLPSLLVDKDGTTTEEVIAPRLTLADLVNRSIMIHASQDDGSPRAACGVFK